MGSGALMVARLQSDKGSFVRSDKGAFQTQSVSRVRVTLDFIVPDLVERALPTIVPCDIGQFQQFDGTWVGDQFGFEVDRGDGNGFVPMLYNEIVPFFEDTIWYGTASGLPIEFGGGFYCEDVGSKRVYIPSHDGDRAQFAGDDYTVLHELSAPAYVEGELFTQDPPLATGVITHQFADLVGTTLGVLNHQGQCAGGQCVSSDITVANYWTLAGDMLETTGDIAFWKKRLYVGNQSGAWIIPSDWGAVNYCGQHWYTGGPHACNDPLYLEWDYFTQYWLWTVGGSPPNRAYGFGFAATNTTFPSFIDGEAITVY